MSASPMTIEAPLVELAWPSQRLKLHDQAEDWTGMTNSVERRKLQNRLNQRARRTRQKTNNDVRSSTFLTTDMRSLQPRIVEKSTNQAKTSAASPRMSIAGTNSGCMAAAPRVQALMQRFAEHAYMSYMQGAPALSHLSLLVKYNATSALRRNAELLGASDEYMQWEGLSPFTKEGPVLGLTSHQESISWPPNLQPTKLQVSVAHHPWVDAFPWPRVRDNLLQAFEHPEICDEDELCHDICDYEDVDSRPPLIIWGSPWDHRNWEVTHEFLVKWGWLLSGCGEILEVSNYWRAKRGERPITPKEFSEAIRLSMPYQRGHAKV